jgi:hypothetical protein
MQEEVLLPKVQDSQRLDLKELKIKKIARTRTNNSNMKFYQIFKKPQEKDKILQ